LLQIVVVVLIVVVVHWPQGFEYDNDNEPASLSCPPEPAALPETSLFRDKVADGFRARD